MFLDDEGLVSVDLKEHEQYSRTVTQEEIFSVCDRFTESSRVFVFSFRNEHSEYSLKGCALDSSVNGLG